MLKVKNGDTEMVALLYQRYSRRMFGFFFRMTCDAPGSEDLVHNVFVRLLKYKNSYAEEGNFESWIFQLARNVHHDHYRKNRRFSWKADIKEIESETPLENNNREREMEKSEELSQLDEAMQLLDHETRELIVMTKFEKMKYRAIGNLLGLKEGAVKVRVYRALKELKMKYEALNE